MAKTLYICYFGVREPLVQTQVIPYLLELMRDLPPRPSATPPNQGGEPIKVTLLTFEPDLKTKWPLEEIEKEKAILAGKGIEWRSLAYHKRPSVPATAYDVFSGAWYIAKLLRKEKYDVLHCRVHIPMLMGAMARKLSKHKPKLLFDIRGFFPEEYTDAGVWPENGWLYRSAKRVEAWLLDQSDGFVVLTEKARDILFPESAHLPPRPSATPPNQGGEQEKNPPAYADGSDRYGRPVEVIPCCVDIEKFRTANEWSRREVQAELDIGKRRVIAYVGSFGGWYLTEEMLDFFAAARAEDPNTFFLILTQRDKEMVRDALLARGFAENDFFVGGVTPGEIPRYLSAADVAISFIKACYSKLSSSPTKIAEYLACGVPVISNRGVGDIDELIEKNGVGVLLDDFSTEAYLSAINAVQELGDVRGKCQETARREFDLEAVGGARYRRIYDELTNDQYEK